MFTLIRFLFKAAFWFVAVSLLWVLAYRFVPVPFTATMAGDLFAGRGVTKNWTALDRIDPDMARAAIAGEDSRFCTHDGFDFRAIAGAAAANARGGRIRGGSTISQQTAKNAFLWQGGGFVRKGFEAWFTVLIELLWPKRRIMEVYLNIAETGIGTYGAEAGARRYFGHSAARRQVERLGLDLGFPLAKQVDHSVRDHPPGQAERPQAGDDLPLEHHLHLARHAGQSADQ